MKPDPRNVTSGILGVTKTGTWLGEYGDGKPPRMYPDDVTLELVGCDKTMTPEEINDFWAAHVDPAYIPAINQYMAKMDAGELSEIEYPYLHPTRGRIYIRCSGRKNPAYENPCRIEGIHREITSLLHISTEKSDAPSYSIGDAAIENFLSSYYIDLTDSTYQKYRISNELNQKYGQIENYFESIKTYIASDVHPDDRIDLLRLVDPEYIREALEVSPHYEHIFRDISDGKVKWYRMQISRGQDEKHAGMSFTDITESIWDKQEKLDIIERLTAEYAFVMKGDCRDATVSAIRMPDGLRTQFGDTDITHPHPMKTATDIFLKYMVLETDREKMRKVLTPEYVSKGLENADTFSDTYLSTFRGPIHYWEAKFAVLTRDESGKAETFLAGFSDIDKDIRARKMVVSDTMSLLQSLADNYESIYYVNPANNSYQIFTPGRGYGKIASDDLVNTNDFFKDTNTNLDLVCHKDDIKRVKAFYTPENLEKILDENKSITTEHRLILEGKVTWYQNKLIKIRDRYGKFRYVIGVVNITHEKELEISAKLDNEVMTALATDYNAVLLIDLDNDEILHRTMTGLIREHMGNFAETEVCYSNGLGHYVRNFVYPADRAKLLEVTSIDNIRKSLVKAKYFELTYRTLISGQPAYTTARFVRVDECGQVPANPYEVHKVAVGFVVSDAEVIYRYAADSVMNSYSSIFLCNVKTNTIKPIKIAGMYAPRDSFTSSDSYSDRIQEYIKTMDPAYQVGWERMISPEALTAYLRDTDYRERTYKVINDKKHPWRKGMMRVIERNENNDVVTFLLIFAVPDEGEANSIKQAEKIGEQFLVISKLAENYGCINYVSLKEDNKNDELINYRLNQDFVEKCPQWAGESNFHNKLELLIEEIAEESDRKRLREKTRRKYVIERLLEAEDFTIAFRAKINGEIRHYQIKFNGFITSGKVDAIVFGIKSIDREKSKADKRFKELVVLADLTEDFDLVTYTDINDVEKQDELSTFKISDAFKERIPEWGRECSVGANMDLIRRRFVCEVDREKFRLETNRSLILHRLAEKPTYYVNFRSEDASGVLRYYQIKFIPYKENNTIKGIVMGLHSVDSETRTELAMQKKLENSIAERTLELREKNRVLNRINDDIVELLGDVIESRDGESGEHIRRVKGFTHILAVEVMNELPRYGLTREKINLMTSAAALHDVGKIGISDTILLKPGKLTPEEFEIMKTHCELGCGVLSKAPLDWSAEYLETSMKICRYHHEKWDGKGYPYGLSGDEIPIEAQIVAIADIFDALISKRCYKPAYTCEAAYRMIKDGECGAFSDDLLRCLDHVRDAFTAYAKDVKLSQSAPVPEMEVEIKAADESKQQAESSGSVCECVLPNVSDAASYAKTAAEKNKLIESGKCPGFALIECDMNSLKTINSLYNWDVGNRYIRECVGIISDVFSHSSIYRLGGDEFAVVAEGEDFVRCETLFTLLRELGGEKPRSDGLPPNSFAAGMAVFDPASDRSFDDVFARADVNMRANKPDKPVSEAETGDVVAGLSVQLLSLLEEDFQALYFIDAVSGRYRVSSGTRQVERGSFLNDADTTADFYVNSRADMAHYVSAEDRDRFLEFFSRENMIKMQAETASSNITFHYMVNDKVCLLRARIVPARAANGAKRLVLGVADITDEAAASVRSSRLSDAMRKCIECISSSKSEAEAISEMLAVAGSYYMADSVNYLKLDRSNNRIFCANQWSREGVCPVVNLQDEIPYDLFLYHVKVFADNGYSECRSIDDAPTPEYAEILRRKNLDSFLLAPVYSDGEISGIIGVNNHRAAFGDLFVLQGIASVINSKIISRISGDEIVRAANIDRKFLEKAILSHAYSYIKINLSKNRVEPPMMGRVNGRIIDVTATYGSNNLSYDEMIADAAKRFAGPEYKESYVREMSCKGLIEKFKAGNTMPEYVCEMDSPHLGWHMRRYLAYLSRDKESGDIYALSVAYDITEQEKLKRERMMFEAEIQKREEELEYVSNLAMRDALTHVGSMASFKEKMNVVNGAIAAGTVKPFAIVECDLNSLKEVNDTFGHEAGNEYITHCCDEICRIFRHSPVFRVGGDEFIVYLEGKDYENRAALLKSLHDLAEYETKKDAFAYTKVSLAAGMSAYLAVEDSKLEDVYRRADSAMYEHKAYLKSL